MTTPTTKITASPLPTPIPAEAPVLRTFVVFVSLPDPVIAGPVAVAVLVPWVSILAIDELPSSVWTVVVVPALIFVVIPAESSEKENVLMANLHLATPLHTSPHLSTPLYTSLHQGLVWKPTYEDLRTKTYEDLPMKTYEDLPTKTYLRRPTSAHAYLGQHVAWVSEADLVGNETWAKQAEGNDAAAPTPYWIHVLMPLPPMKVDEQSVPTGVNVENEKQNRPGLYYSGKLWSREGGAAGCYGAEEDDRNNGGLSSCLKPK
ncbi:hypothetical protein CHU98_g10788 [Xylaria longipes]|nr:hypothetical protein CHU98_g10788 [Xylaria longipes]